MSKQFVSIYEKDGVQIWGKIEAHTSYFTGMTIDEIWHLKITKNNTLVYEAYGNALRYPIGHENKDMVDFVNIVDDVVFLINYDSKNEAYSSYQSKVVPESMLILDEILYKNSSKGILGLNRLKREHKEAMRQKEYNDIQDQNKALIKEATTIANSKGVYFEATIDGCVVKTIEVPYKDMEKYALIGEKQQKEVKSYIVKLFSEYDYNKSEYKYYNESNNNMLKDVIEFLKSYNKKIA